MTRIVVVYLSLITWSTFSYASDVTFQSVVKPFLQQHCVRCHGPKKENGERRFDTLAAEITDSNSLADLQDILDQLNLGEMPPADEPQPKDADRRVVTEWLTKTIDAWHKSRSDHGHETILRRLNSREYRNTVRDLLSVNTLIFDPTAEFPRDQKVEHLDNIGNALVTSGFLLQQYLAAAEVIVEKAVYPLKRPQKQTWSFTNGFRQQPEIDQVHRKTNLYDHMTLYDVVGADKHEGAYGPIHAFKEGVPFDGYYEIRLKAEAVNRRHPYDQDFIGTDPDEPLRLGIVPGHHEAGPLHKPQPVEPLLAEIELADKPEWYTVRVWLDQGYTPRFTFRNGLMDVRNLWGKLVKRYPDQFPKEKNPGIVSNRFNAIKFGRLPQIHIHEIEIEGPLIEQWPRPSQLSVLGPNAEQILSSGHMTDEDMHRQLQAFAFRAYRRKPAQDEVDRVLDIVGKRRQAGRSDIEAFCDGIKTVLCSPAFVYLEEADKDGLSLTARMTRLSYFLWSSMPDDALLQTAGAIGPEAQPKAMGLDTEVERMLNDSKSDAFVDGFLGSWLTLSDFGSQPPDRDQFRRYYHYDLGTAMQEETRLFTRHLLDENLSVVNFLDSEFTFVNRRLAEHYGIAGPTKSGFHRVALGDRRRGGLLGQGSVLTVTANGIDTSPVVRGVWMLENILGTPPSPPPPDVEPLDPDIRGAKTIREQLAKHRKIASCNDCHRKIDPMGFALENFDPIGRWRTSYGPKLTIDASGELPNGTRYDDVISFKKIMMQQQDQFIRALVSKMLAYALGREIDASDRPMVDEITTELSKRGNGLRDLVKLVARAIH